MNHTTSLAQGFGQPGRPALRRTAGDAVRTRLAGGAWRAGVRDLAGQPLPTRVRRAQRGLTVVCPELIAGMLPQWTGIVTSIAIEMLESGRVDAVVCVQSDEDDRFTPKPVGRSILSMFHPRI